MTTTARQEAFGVFGCVPVEMVRRWLRRERRKMRSAESDANGCCMGDKTVNVDGLGHFGSDGEWLKRQPVERSHIALSATRLDGVGVGI